MIVSTAFFFSTAIPAVTWLGADTAAEQWGTTELELSIARGVTSPATRARQLTCDPPGGDHPYRTLACHDLTVAGGNFDALPGEAGKTCSGLYEPVTATALGEWRGMPLRFQRTYLNPCRLNAATGPVFRF